MTTKRNKGKVGFFGLVADRIAHLKEQGKKKTARNYECALKHFIAFRKGKDISVDGLSVSLITDFQNYLQVRGLCLNTISLYMRTLRAAYNYAVDEELADVDRKPFRKAFTGNEKTRKRALKENVVKRLIALDFGGNRQLELARDLFLFSIYTQGMAFVDIAHLTKKQLHGKCIVYRRRKTYQQITVALQPCALAIIEKYRVADGGCPYLFPILYDPASGKMVGYDTALRTHNKRLARIGKLWLKLDTPLSSYVSRHTWASLAKWKGVSVSVICEAMGHQNEGTTGIYLASLGTDTVAAANRKILTSLFHTRL